MENALFWKGCSKINGFRMFDKFPETLFLGKYLEFYHFWGNITTFGGVFGKSFINGKAERKGTVMRRKGYKGRCQKRALSKCNDVCRTYDELQYAYADILEGCEGVKEIRCNVLLDGLAEGEYTSDFVCVKTDNDLMVRECVSRKFLLKPMTVRLLDASRAYWLKHGVADWGIVTDREGAADGEK